MRTAARLLQADITARSVCVNTRCRCVNLAASTTRVTDPHEAEMTTLPFNACVYRVLRDPCIKQGFHKPP